MFKRESIQCFGGTIVYMRKIVLDHSEAHFKGTWALHMDHHGTCIEMVLSLVLLIILSLTILLIEYKLNEYSRLLDN